jgi:hypothetical protein
MRLRIFAIPRLALFVAGMFPSLTWCAFHPVSVTFQREDFFWVVGIGICTGFFLSVLIRRGFFLARYFVYLLFTLGIGVTLLGAVMDRDFASLGIGLVAFFLFLGIVIWLEKNIDSAALNPEHEWYEGVLRMIPTLAASIRLGDHLHPAHVRRIDSRGMFLFFDQPVSFKAGQRVVVEMDSGTRKVSGEAKVAARFEGKKVGFGLQFLPKDLYHFAEYSALVQELRGRGL